MGLLQEFDQEISDFVAEHNVDFERIEDANCIYWRLPEATTRVVGVAYDKDLRLYGVINASGAILAHHSWSRTKALFKRAVVEVQRRKPLYGPFKVQPPDRTFELEE